MYGDGFGGDEGGLSGFGGGFERAAIHADFEGR